MGLAIDRSEFSDAEYALAARRLRENLAALKALLERPGFGHGEASLGAELEMSVVGPDAAALPVNKEILAASNDPNLQLELNKFNLEYNLSPVVAAGQPFAALQGELTDALRRLREQASKYDGRIIPIGILPTLQMDQLQTDWMTDLPRYHALNAGIIRMHGQNQQIQINGDDPLDVEFASCTAEGANNSFQVHLRVNPDDFANYYNAAQMATPLALAVSANSPWFLGHSLWDETRIALFKQAVDTRRHRHEWRRMARVPFGHGWVRKGAYELFAESCYLYPILIPVCGDADDLGVVQDGGTPELAELRLQQGTVWNWNRPVYDPADGGHLRIELRSLPSGPTPADMMASAAFHVGLTVGLSHKVESLLSAFPFRYADFNFYRAAQSSLEAQLLWPVLDETSPRQEVATQLCHELLPVADEGLAEIGVDERERRFLLGLIGDRLRSRQTPAQWQRRFVAEKGDVPRETALQELVQQYLDKSESLAPFTEW
ncbi:MAG: glutamate-cysteine ligase family protein [Gammaproteobacteria bacterium]|nr:glutamate-cysteine ligase family protein [Gammaproteobacteria bacterium]